MNQSAQRKDTRTLLITAFVSFLGFLDTMLLLPVMALYATGLGAGIGTAGIIIGLYSITNTLANILFGRLIDRIGFKAPLVIGLIGDALSMFAYSLARSPIHLVLVRVLHGTSGGLLGPATMYIFSGVTGMAKGRAMAIYGIAIATATLVGFAMSGVITSLWNYNMLFYIGAVLLTIGVVLSLLLPGKELGKETVVETSLRDTLRRVKGLLLRKSLIVSYSAVFAQYFTFGGVVTLLPLYLKNLGMEAFHVGMLLATFTVMFIIVQFPSGALSDKTGRLLPIISGLSLGIVSLLVLSSLSTFPLLAVAMALYGVAYGLLFPSISALVAEHTSPEERGLATGLFHALLTVGVAIGAPITGWIGEVAGVGWGLVLTPAIMVLALFIALTRLRRA